MAIAKRADTAPEPRFVVKAIRGYLHRLPIGGIFTTTQLIVAGLPRKSLDTALSRMVKSGEIERLVYGVFRGSSPFPPPSKDEIKQIKRDLLDKVMASMNIDVSVPSVAEQPEEAPDTTVIVFPEHHVFNLN